MRPRMISLLLIIVAACARDSSEQRLRQYFALASDVPADTAALASAILEQLKAGTSEARVAVALSAHGVGRDSLSSYYPPTDSDTGLVRVEHDRNGTNVVVKSYLVRLVFDSTRKLSTVGVTQWLTGP